MENGCKRAIRDQSRLSSHTCAMAQLKCAEKTREKGKTFLCVCPLLLVNGLTRRQTRHFHFISQVCGHFRFASSNFIVRIYSVYICAIQFPTTDCFDIYRYGLLAGRQKFYSKCDAIVQLTFNRRYFIDAAKRTKQPKNGMKKKEKRTSDRELIGMESHI